MALNGSGTFTRLYNWTTDKANSVRIRADKFDAEMDGMATALSTALYKDGQQTPTANLPMGGFKLTGLGAPASAADSATKQYVDDNVTAFTNFTVRGATTASVTIATALNNGDTLDGLTLVDGDLILVKNQATASQNGVYVVGAVPARSTSFDTWDEHVNSIINVTAGTTNAGLSFRCTNNAGGTLDTTDITYVQFGSSVTLPLPISSGGTGQTAAPAALGALINGATSESTVATDDTVGIYDTSESTGNKATVENFLKVINALTEDATPDTAADFVLSYDTSASTVKKVKPTNLAAGSSAADQSGMEAASSTSTYVSPGRQHFHPGHPKAAAKVTVSGGTPTLQSTTDFNITSITDTGTGRLTITIATDFSDAHWVCAASIQSTPDTSSSVGGYINHTVVVKSQAAGSVELNCLEWAIDADGSSQTVALGDPEAWHMIGIGDHS
jgi:hypothetical protein